MIRLRSAAALAVAVIVVWLSATGGAQRGQFSQDEMKQWLTYIASDALQGRQVFTEGYGLASAYVAEQLKSFGVVPGGDSGTYFQAVSLRGMRTRSSSNVTVTVNGETRIFKDGDGVTFPRNQGGKQTISAGVEFAGYGMPGGEAKRDNSGRPMVKGKVAVFLGSARPGMSPAQNLLVGGRRNAVELYGAVAVISAPANAGRGRGAGAAAAPAQPQSTTQPNPTAQAPPAAQGNAAQRTDFQTVQNLDAPIPPQITGSDSFFEFLFSASGHSYATLRDLATRLDPLPDVALGDVRLTITVDAEYEPVQTRLTRNVVGIVRGTDSKLRDTYVAIGAHLDHIGYRQFAPVSGGAAGAAGRAGPPAAADAAGGAGAAGAAGVGPTGACTGQPPSPRPGDIINNGADDDGSGVVSLLAIAKAFATGQKPKRSVVFIWHSGEEEGLYGSRYMADYPVLPAAGMVAMLNVDMVGRNRCDDPAQANTVYVVGADRISTELHNLNERTNASLSRPLTLNYELNDVADPQSFYTRSDHYSYAQKGVPIIFYSTGLHRDYHGVTDEVDKIEFGKMARIAELIHATALRVANLDHAPARDFAGPRVGKGQTGPIR